MAKDNFMTKLLRDKEITMEITGNGSTMSQCGLSIEPGSGICCGGRHRETQKEVHAAFSKY